jgi:hypothetical protein
VLDVDEERIIYHGMDVCSYTASMRRRIWNSVLPRSQAYGPR